LLGYRSNNFVVGLTNDHPVLHTPVLWNYTLCGQYPGTVPDGATASVRCTNVYKSGLTFRFVIVQFPLINEPMNFCEIEVFAVGKHFHCAIGSGLGPSVVVREERPCPRGRGSSRTNFQVLVLVLVFGSSSPRKL